MTSNLASNLALLRNSFDSVTDLCRQLGVNRQQFNRYLGGKQVPSPRVLKRMSGFFSMEPDDLLRKPSEFKVICNGGDPAFPFDLGDAPSLLRFLPLMSSSEDALKELCGVYYRYHHSSTAKGTVLRSVVWLRERESVIECVTVERFPLTNESTPRHCSFSYNGYCMMLGQRVFLVDFEGRRKSELAFSVLTPQPRRPSRFMYGLLTRIEPTSHRQAFSTRVALARVGHGGLTKQHLRHATTMQLEDPSIPEEVRAYLSESDQQSVWA
ncbi:helix-turn-helix transcriptional regulator [Caballeronia sp. J97]|uniref:helix-turn-helix transcriptional regulator n=1 Tax=Caballeronia sp. J97 TaxID=2805429 RepID=UPI002AB17A0E|nr:helix-turn-helix transcriptional regulator [Caballeronia sp. J97]